MIWFAVGLFCVTGGGLEAQEMRKKPKRRMNMKEKEFLRTIFPPEKKTQLLD